MELARKLAGDKSPAVRREIAFYLRNEPGTPEVVSTLVKIAKGYDGKDRSYLEAFGTGATDKEEAVYAALVKDVKAAAWDGATAGAVWRLMTAAAIPALRDRVFDGNLETEDRMQALESIAFVRSGSAATAMVEIANLAPDKELAERAGFWVKWNNDRWWKAHKPAENLKGGNARAELVSVVIPEEKASSKLPPVD